MKDTEECVIKYPKKVNCWLHNACVRRREGNFVYDHNIVLFRAMQFFGIFPVALNKKGRFEFQWNSCLSIYTIILIAVLISFTAYTTIMELGSWTRSQFVFDDAIMCFVLITSACVRFVPVILLFEARKLAAFLNDWTDFQEHFERVTKRKITNYSVNKINFILACCSLFKIVVLLRGNANKFNDLFNKYEMQEYHAMLINISCIFCLLVLTSLLLTWRSFNGALSASAGSLLQEIQTLQWAATESFDDHVSLWLDLRSLCHNLGATLCWAFLAITSIIFLLCLPSLYVGTHSVIKGDFWSLYPIIATLAYISVFTGFSHIAVDKVGVDFQTGLTKVLQKTNSTRQRKELRKWIQLIGSCPPIMTLGGFFRLDRGVNISLYSNIITYFIIMMTFRPSDNN